MIGWLCWGLIYVARALEFVRLHWGSAVTETPLSRWTTRPMRCVFIVTRLGVALMWPIGWMSPASVALVRLANRGLPPLHPRDGFLVRLHPVSDEELAWRRSAPRTRKSA